LNVKKDKPGESAGPNAGTLDILPEGEVVFPKGEGEVPISEPDKAVTRIYLGPNLRAGRLLQSTVFRGGTPAYLQPLLDELPDVAALIVPVDEISDVQARIARTGTPEYGAYNAILKGGF
jgi:hypothetical protein